MNVFRIVPCVGKRVYYKVQVRTLFWWSDIKDNAFLTYPKTFGSINKATKYIISEYGKSAVITNFEAA